MVYYRPMTFISIVIPFFLIQQRTILVHLFAVNVSKSGKWLSLGFHDIRTIKIHSTFCHTGAHACSQDQKLHWDSCYLKRFKVHLLLLVQQVLFKERIFYWWQWHHAFISNQSNTKVPSIFFLFFFSLFLCLCYFRHNVFLHYIYFLVLTMHFGKKEGLSQIVIGGECYPSHSMRITPTQRPCTSSLHLEDVELGPYLCGCDAFFSSITITA